MSIKEQFCWYCGTSLGVYDQRLHDRDTCGAAECERERWHQDLCEDADARAEAEADDYERYRGAYW